MKSGKNNLFVFDVDGTLMAPSSNRIDSEALEAIARVKEYGEVALASARPLKGILNLDPGAIDHVIALNGSLVFSSGKIRASFPLPREFVCSILYKHNDYKNIWFYSEDTWFAADTSTVEYYQEKYAVSYDAAPLDSYDAQEILKITIVDPGEIDKIIDEISQLKSIKGNFSNENYIEINSIEADKYSAISCLINDPEVRLFTFCDSDNDLSLLKNSFYGCVPANASANAKAAASYISEFRYGEGVLDSVNHALSTILRQ